MDLAAHLLEHYVSDVVAVLDTLQVPSVAFWGYSDGRCVGYELAHRYPKRVTALLASGGHGSSRWNHLSSRETKASTQR